MTLEFIEKFVLRGVGVRGRGRAALAAAAFAGIVAIACGSSDSAAAPTVAAPPPTQAPQPEPTVAAAEPTEMPEGDGVSEPASDEAPLVKRQPDFDITEQPLLSRARLLGWGTDFELRTINLGELFISLQRDAIRPIDDPRYESIADAEQRLDPKEPVIVVEIEGDARAYPLSILVNHEIVNDTIGGVPVTVTFCPLCNSSIVFERVVDGVEHTFGTSGMLRNSDLVMWDRETETLWQQLTGEAIVGERTGRKMTFLASQVASFDEFAAKWADGLVLSPPRSQPYLRTAYQGYDDVDAEDPFLFSGPVDPRLPATSRVAALSLGGDAVAYSFELLAEHPVLNVESGGLPVVIFFDDTTESAFRSIERGRSGEINISGSSTTYLREVGEQVLTFVLGEDGSFRDEQTGSTWDRFGEAVSGELAGAQLDPVIHGDHFWFAWAAFEPETELITDISQLDQT